MTRLRTNTGSKGKYTVHQTGTAEQYMDPRLQSIASAEGTEQVLSQTFVRMTTEGRPVVDVIAELRDPNQEVPGLRIVTQTGNLVTGTVELPRLKEVSAHDNVLRLSGGERVTQELTACLPEIRGQHSDIQAELPQGATVPDGAGVIVGIVDYGCDFLHRNFRNADGSARILFLWDQNGSPSELTPAPLPYGYGREITAALLDQALERETPPPSPPQNPEDANNEAYIYLGYRPQEPGDRPSHGTHVMDIAAGNGRGTGAPGVAPNADIIFVHLYQSQDDLLDDSRQSFASSPRLIQAVDYIFRKAKELNRPAVVNLSLGTYGGSHDGTRDADRIFDGMLAEPGRSIVVSAGNSFFLRTHASGEVTAQSPRTLTWQVQYTGPVLDNELEIWYPGNSKLDAALIDPDGDVIGPIQLESPAEQDVRIGNKLVIRIRHLRDPVNQDNLLGIFFFPDSGLSVGDWKIELGTASITPVPFHAWIDRTNNDFQSRFVAADANSAHTLGSIACGLRPIAVGAYNARGTGRPIASFSSAGPTRDGREKPEVSAPGGEINDGVRAARSLTHTRVTSMAGTSMAAPHVTGLVALLLQQGGADLTTDQIRQALLQTLRRNPPAGNGWDARYGHGKIDTRSAVGALVSSGQPQATAGLVPTKLMQVGAESTDPDVENGFLDRISVLVARNRLRMSIQVEIEPYE